MHEGLMILSKSSDKRLLFSNRPIEKFLNAAISASVQNHENPKGKQSLLTPKLFTPIHKISATNRSSEETDEAVGLEQIIVAQMDEPQ